jgi:DNA topoisomerase-1
MMGQYQGQNVIIKSGKYGAYIVWGSMNISLKPLLGGGGGRGHGGGGSKSEFDLSLQDVITFIEKSSGGAAVGSEPETDGAATETATTAPYQGQILRTIDENTTIRYGRYGPYIFHKTAKMTKPVFVAVKGFPEKHGNYMTCDASVIHEWIAADAAAPPKPKPKIPFKFYKK